MIAVFIFLAVLALGFGWLFLGLVRLSRRIDMLEFQQREKIDADAKILAALNEANALKTTVREFESTVTEANRKVGKIVSRQAELDADRTERQKREKKVRRVVLPLAQGW